MTIPGAWEGLIKAICLSAWARVDHGQTSAASAEGIWPHRGRTCTSVVLSQNPRSLQLPTANEEGSVLPSLRLGGPE